MQPSSAAAHTPPKFGKQQDSRFDAVGKPFDARWGGQTRTQLMRSCSAPIEPPSTSVAQVEAALKIQLQLAKEDKTAHWQHSRQEVDQEKRRVALIIRREIENGPAHTVADPLDRVSSDPMIEERHVASVEAGWGTTWAKDAWQQRCMEEVSKDELKSSGIVQDKYDDVRLQVEQEVSHELKQRIRKRQMRHKHSETPQFGETWDDDIDEAGPHKRFIELPALTDALERKLKTLWTLLHEGVPRTATHWNTDVVDIETMRHLKPLDALLSLDQMEEIVHGALAATEGMVSWAGFEQFILQAAAVSFETLDKTSRGHVFTEEIMILASRMHITQRTLVQSCDWDGDGMIYLSDWADFVLSQLLAVAQNAGQEAQAGWPDQQDRAIEDAIRELFMLRDIHASGLLPFEDVCAMVLPTDINLDTRPMRAQTWVRVYPGQEQVSSHQTLIIHPPRPLPSTSRQ